MSASLGRKKLNPFQMIAAQGFEPMIIRDILRKQLKLIRIEFIFEALSETAKLYQECKYFYVFFLKNFNF